MNRRLRLHPGVFYRTYKDLTVLFHTGAREVFTFNSTAADILSCFRTYTDVDAAINVLGDAYDATDDEFESSIRSFVNDALGYGILQTEYKQTENKNDLERKISASLADTGILYSAMIELTYRCNEKCRHCFIVDERRKELTTEKLKSVLDELADRGVCNLIFTGGEVFMRKDAFEILEHAYQQGFATDIFTNGVLLNAAACIRLKSLWPRCVHFSVYSHVPEKHDAITKVRGSFQRTLTSIRSCSSIGIPVNIKSPILAETLNDIPGLVALAESNGASIELSKNIVPRKDGKLDGTTLKIRDDKEYEQFSLMVDKLLDGTDPQDRPREKRTRICGAGDHSICINPYGEVYPCNTLPLVIGDVHTQTVRQIWEESPQLHWWRDNNYRANLTGCGTCPLTADCVFCPGEAMLRTGDPLHMYTDACTSTHLSTLNSGERG